MSVRFRPNFISGCAACSSVQQLNHPPERMSVEDALRRPLTLPAAQRWSIVALKIRNRHRPSQRTFLKKSDKHKVIKIFCSFWARGSRTELTENDGGKTRQTCCRKMLHPLRIGGRREDVNFKGSLVESQQRRNDPMRTILHCWGVMMLFLKKLLYLAEQE